MVMVLGPSSSARNLTSLDTKNWKNTRVAVGRRDMLDCKQSHHQPAGQWCLIYSNESSLVPITVVMFVLH